MRKSFIALLLIGFSSMYLYSKNENSLSNLFVETGNTSTINNICISGDEKYMVTVESKKMVIYDTKTHKELKIVNLNKFERLRDCAINHDKVFLVGDKQLITYDLNERSLRYEHLTYTPYKIFKSADQKILIYGYNDISIIKNPNGKMQNINLKINNATIEKILSLNNNGLFILAGNGSLIKVNLKTNTSKIIINGESHDFLNNPDLNISNEFKEYPDGYADGYLDLENGYLTILMNYDNYDSSAIIKYDLYGNIVFVKKYSDEFHSLYVYQNKIYVSNHFGNVSVFNYDNGKLIRYNLFKNNSKPFQGGPSYSRLLLSNKTNSLYISSGKFIYQYDLTDLSNDIKCYIYGSNFPSIQALAYDKNEKILYTGKYDSTNYYNSFGKWDLTSGTRLKTFGKQTDIINDIKLYKNTMYVLEYGKLYSMGMKTLKRNFFTKVKTNNKSKIKLDIDKDTLFVSGLKLYKINIKNNVTDLILDNLNTVDFELLDSQKLILAEYWKSLYKLNLANNTTDFEKLPIKEFVGDSSHLSLSADHKYLIYNSVGCRISVYRVKDYKNIIKNKNLCRGMSDITHIFSVDKNKIMISTYGDGLYIFDYFKDKNIRILDFYDNQCNYILPLENIKKYAIAYSNGSIVILNNDYEVVLRLFEISDNDWLAITPEGYFTGSKDAAKYLNITKYTKDGMEPFDFSQLYDHFFRPDLVKLKLSGYEEAYQKATKGLTYKEALKNPPPKLSFKTIDNKAVKISGFEYDVVNTINKKVKITFNIKDENGGIGLIRIYQEGKLIKTIGKGKINKNSANLDTVLEQQKLDKQAKARQKEYIALASKAIDHNFKLSIEDTINGVQEDNTTNKEGNYTIEVELKSGENDIGIEAFNKTNTVSSYRETININANIPKQKPKLYAIIAGVNEFESPNVENLKYSQNDAKAIKEIIEKNARNIFDKVEVKYLIGKDVTQKNILQSAKEIAKEANLNDTVIFYISTHGRAVKGKLFLVPYNNKLASNWIDFGKVFNTIQSIKALNQIFIVDACESGEANDIVSSVYDSRASVLAKSSGVHMLLAATKGTYAFESKDPNVKNSVFTHKILKALKDKKTDIDRDSYISILELSKKLKEPSNNAEYQYPVIRNVGDNIRLEKVE